MSDFDLEQRVKSLVDDWFDHLGANPFMWANVKEHLEEKVLEQFSSCAKNAKNVWSVGVNGESLNG